MTERPEGTRTSSDAATQPPRDVPAHDRVTRDERARDDAAAVADKQIQRWKGEGGAWLPSD